MSIVYLGKASDLITLHQQPGAAWSKSEENLDVFSVTFSGPKSAYDNWEKSNQLGSKLAGFPAMYLVESPREDGRSFVVVQCRYIGLRNPSVAPLPNMSRRTSMKTASNSVESPEPASMDLTYVSPEVVFNYATDKKVMAPQFDPTRITPKEAKPEYAERVIRRVITTEAGKRYTGNAPAPLASALAMTPEWVMATLDSTEIKYTPFWANQEVWAYEYPQS